MQGYIADHEVPVNPLLDQGYTSIGCQPCTSLPADGDDPRSGRWAGRGKTECGIHSCSVLSSLTARWRGERRQPV